MRFFTFFAVLLLCRINEASASPVQESSATAASHKRILRVDPEETAKRAGLATRSPVEARPTESPWAMEWQLPSVKSISRRSHGLNAEASLLSSGEVAVSEKNSARDEHGEASGSRKHQVTGGHLPHEVAHRRAQHKLASGLARQKVAINKGAASLLHMASNRTRSVQQKPLQGSRDATIPPLPRQQDESHVNALGQVRAVPDTPPEDDDTARGNATKQKLSQLGASQSVTSSIKAAAPFGWTAPYQGRLFLALAVLIAFIAVSFCGTCVPAAPANPNAIPVDAEAINSELSKAKARQEQLETALAAIPTEAAPAPAPAPAPAADPEALMGEMLEKTSQANKELNSQLQKAKPYVDKASEIQAVVNSGVREMKGEILTAASKGANGILTSVNSTLGPGFEKLELDLSNAGKLDVELPPADMLLAGLQASMSIWLISEFCASRLWWNNVTMLICVAVCWFNWNLSCPVHWIWEWLFSTMVFCFVYRYTLGVVKSNADASVLKLAAEELAQPTITGLPIMDFLTSVKIYSRYYFRALYLKDKVTKTWSFFFYHILRLIQIIFGIIAVVVNFSYPKLEDACPSPSLVLWFRIYIWFFTLAFTWLMFGIIVWCLSLLSTNPSFRATVVEFAKYMDDGGPPIYMTLARAFLVRDSSAQSRSVAQQLERDADDLRKEVAQLQTGIAALEKEKAHFEAREAELKKKEDGQIARYHKQLEDSINSLAPAALSIDAMIAVTGGGLNDSGQAAAAPPATPTASSVPAASAASPGKTDSAPSSPGDIKMF